MVRAQAKERQGRAGKKRSSKLDEHASTGRTDKKVAEAVGMKKDSYRKAKNVVEAAEQQPEQFAEVVEEMDRTGRVDPAYKKVKAAKAASKTKHATKGAKKSKSATKPVLPFLGETPQRNRPFVSLLLCGHFVLFLTMTLSLLPQSSPSGPSASLPPPSAAANPSPSPAEGPSSRLPRCRSIEPASSIGTSLHRSLSTTGT